MSKSLVSRLHALRDVLYAHPYTVLLAIGMVATAVYLVAIPLPRVDGQLVGGDGIDYYMYVRSFWIDGDLDFYNEYQYFYGVSPRTIPATGMTHNQYGIGCGLLWSPFFLLAHAIAALLNLFGIRTPMDGYSYLYQGITLFGTIVYGMLGLLLSYRLATKLYERTTALLATVSIWLASNVLYYMIAEPSMSHAIAMFAIALFVFYGTTTGSERRTSQWAVLGLLGSLILLIRLPDGPYLIIPAVESLYVLVKLIKARDARRLRKHILNNVIFLVTLILGFVPQMLSSYSIYGRFFASGYGDKIETKMFSWFSPKIVQILFSSRHGLFSWHPVLFFAVLGLVFFLYRKHKVLALSLNAAFVANLYVLSAWAVWWQAAAFGGRKFMDGSVIFVLGLAALIDRVKQRHDTLWVELGALSLMVWNALFMVQYRFGFVSLLGPLTFKEMVWDKFLLPLRLLQRLFR